MTWVCYDYTTFKNTHYNVQETSYEYGFAHIRYSPLAEYTALRYVWQNHKQSLSQPTVIRATSKKYLTMLQIPTHPQKDEE